MKQDKEMGHSKKLKYYKDYPWHVPIKRYEVKIGKFGAYFYDRQYRCEMSLDDVVSSLERLELRTKQLNWYVEKYGENAAE